MKKAVIGYIYDNSRPSIEDKKFFKIAKKKNIELVPFNISYELEQDKIEEKAKKCDIIFNDAGEMIAIELVKTLEALGKQVYEKSDAAYYMEDKWIFAVKCRKHKIPTPKTILLSDNLKTAKKELINFNSWPVVLKRVFGCRGEFVEKADNPDEAIETIKHLWKKGNEKLPIIAQEFIESDSYRVTLINNEIVQTAIKKRHGWKATGCNDLKFRRFKLDSDIERMALKLAKISKIKICGIDFAKNKGKWLAIEINAEPSLKLYDTDHDMMIGKTLDFLKNSIK